ncbi:MAG: prepilin peptidase [bacterium]|nr:prepilin peptidase [bacterium]
MQNIILFIFGCAIGSFLNVVADRLSFDLSINGRSHCDFCKKKLAWFDLVPVLSFLIIQGKCRYCHKKLSLFYPFVEIVTGVMFVLTWQYLPSGLVMDFAKYPSYFLFKFAYLGIISCLIAIFFADMKYHIIPDQVQIAFFIFSLVALPMHGLVLKVFVDYVIAAFVVASPIAFLHYVTKGNGMGFGDVKLAFVIGFLMGIKQGFIVLYFAFIFGAIVGTLFMFLKKRGLKSKIAFGPFLVLGLIIMFFWGNWIFEVIKKIYGV